MNDVYVSGYVSGNPILKMERENIPHLLFYVDIQHKSKGGKIHHEMYPANVWHNAALRASEKLRNGQYVMLHGYLTQRPVRADDMAYMLTELTVKDFISSHQANSKTESSAEYTDDKTIIPELPNNVMPEAEQCKQTPAH